MQTVSGARHVVTVVFSDLKGSTSLGETLDAEALRGVLSRYFEEMQIVIEAHGGSIEKIIGDAIVAVFGLPEPSDEDPRSAVAAVVEAADALERLNAHLERAWGVRLVNRTGVATGEVVVGTDEGGRHVLSGPAMETAEALEGAAPPGEALITESTYAHVGDVVVVEPHEAVSGGDDGSPIPVHRLVAYGEGTAQAAEAVAVQCPDCGSSNPARARRCGNCGALLGSAEEGVETRRTVTVVFADPKPRWRDAQRSTPEAVEAIMTRYFDVMRAVLERHGATVEKFIGDALMAVFGIPRRHEDDAKRAVEAALEMQSALVELNREVDAGWGVELLNPIGVNTGEVVAGDAALGERLVTGDAVNVAARLEQTAGGGQVVIGPLTRRLLEGGFDLETLEPLSLKGKAEPMPAYRVLGTRSDSSARQRASTPMVGRAKERRNLSEIARDAFDHDHCRVVTLVAGAGVGKSRLTEAFLEDLESTTTVLTGRCLSYGDGITFWPVTEMVNQASGIDPDDPPEAAIAKIAGLIGTDHDAVVDRLASLLGFASSDYRVAEYFWAVRRFLEILSSAQPVVVVFDDIHWAEPTFLDLVEHLRDTSSRGTMVLCTARPDLLEGRPDWGTDDRSSRIVLEPLTADEAAEIVDHLIGHAGLDEGVRARVVAAADGNPLFVEQLMSMLIDDGKLALDSGRWIPTEDLSTMAVPPSIDALLAARLDRLPASESGVVSPASVVGQRFPTEALAELVVPDLRPGLGAYLAALTEKDLVQAVTGGGEAEDGAVYRFQHLLVRDAAYRGLLKQTRADLHERFVDWAEVVNRERDREAEFEEIHGYHLEQAYTYWRELGPLSDHAIELGLRAARKLASAGERAFTRGDLPAAANLLERAVALLPDDHPSRPHLLLMLGESRLQLGDFVGAAETLSVAEATSLDIGDRASAASARIESLRLHYLTEAAVSSDDIVEEVELARRTLDELDHDDGQARAWRLLANIEITGMQWRRVEVAAGNALTHAHAASNRVLELGSLPIVAGGVSYGPTPVDEALEVCTELLKRTSGDRRAEVSIQLQMARLEAMRGGFSEARRLCRQGRGVLEEYGWTYHSAQVSIQSGPIELMAGDPAAAEAELRKDYETLSAMGESNYIATTAGLLAEALYRQGKLDDAGEFAAFARRTAAEDDAAPQMSWRQVEAKIRAAQGSAEEADRLINEAIELTRLSDDVVDQGNALVDQAEVLVLTGRPGEATSVLEAAIELYERKGNVVGAERARGQLAATMAGEER